MDGVVPAGEGVLRSGGGVWPCVPARLDLCVGGGMAQIQGTVPVGGQRRWIQSVRQSMASPRWASAFPEVIWARARAGGLSPGGRTPLRTLCWVVGSPTAPGGAAPGASMVSVPLTSRSGYHVVVPALEDCNPEFRRGVVTVCRWGGRSSSGLRRPAARRAVARVGAVACSHCSGRFGFAGWSFSAEARRRRTVPRRVTLMSVSCVRAWPDSMGGIQTCWPWVCLRARQSTRSTMASWRLLPGVVRSQKALCDGLCQAGGCLQPDRDPVA